MHNQVQLITITEMIPHIMAIVAVIASVVSFVVFIFSAYRKIDRRIDEKIDAKIKPSIAILADTVVVVKNLEKNTAEINATLAILRDILLSQQIKIDKN